IAKAGLTAPEFQITNETTTTGYANFMLWPPERNTTIWAQQQGQTDPDYLVTDDTAELPLAGTPASLVDRMNLILCAGQMTSATRTLILNAVQAVPKTDALHRIATAVYLTMNSPDYIVQK
ncbi:hypothetical protein, partial [Stenotrophomonas sp. A3_2]|uniref:hypothetical protein n=1 Tax=Stenotrophomonas sp. A3_2 TaxID=3119978 RepID=UPI002FC388EE